MASMSIEEQETVIIIPRDSKTARISTSDSTMKTKLDKLCESSPALYRLTERDSENIFSFYEVKDKSLISFRQKKREISEERKQAAAERFKQMHAKKKEG